MPLRKKNVLKLGYKGFYIWCHFFERSIRVFDMHRNLSNNNISMKTIIIDFDSNWDGTNEMTVKPLWNLAKSKSITITFDNLNYFCSIFDVKFNARFAIIWLNITYRYNPLELLFVFATTANPSKIKAIDNMCLWHCCTVWDHEIDGQHLFYICTQMLRGSNVGNAIKIASLWWKLIPLIFNNM